MTPEDAFKNTKAFWSKPDNITLLKDSLIYLFKNTHYDSSILKDRIDTHWAAFSKKYNQNNSPSKVTINRFLSIGENVKPTSQIRSHLHKNKIAILLNTISGELPENNLLNNHSYSKLLDDFRSFVQSIPSPVRQGDHPEQIDSDSDLLRARSGAEPGDAEIALMTALRMIGVKKENVS